MFDVEINDTFYLTWINSSVTPTTIQSRIYDNANTLVHSADMVSSGSGSGHFYQLVSVQTPGAYVAETYALINSNPYTKRTPFRAFKLTVGG